MSTPSVPVGNTYDKEATAHPLERRMVDGFDSALASLVPRDATRVLEVGCGEGNQLRRVSAMLPDARLIGVDLPGLEHTWTGVDALCGSALDLPVASGSVELVLGLEVLEHVADPERAMAEVARTTSRWAVLSVPWEPAWRMGNVLRGRYVRALGNTPGHVQHFGRTSFVSLVSRHMRVVAVRRPFPWTMVLASRP